MSTGRWLVACVVRHLGVASAGWAVAMTLLPGSESFFSRFADGMRAGLVVLPLLTLATLFVVTLLADRRFEPPTGSAARIRGGWMILLPLLLLLPAALLVPVQYAVMVAAQAVYVVFVLPCPDARAAAAVVRRVGDPALPAAERIRAAAALEPFATRPVLEALTTAVAGPWPGSDVPPDPAPDPEVAGAALETLIAIWRREGAAGEDLLRRLPEQARQRVLAQPIKVRSPW
ncbi:hypothetical protein [Streptomyces sp. NPDC091268]|uniref:hypothetical protein n=1 Tax=Streptomyces sp. NPDC091268 TaxID=3365979 RepID=UPI0038216FDE